MSGGNHRRACAISLPPDPHSPFADLYLTRKLARLRTEARAFSSAQNLPGTEKCHCCTITSGRPATGAHAIALIGAQRGVDGDRVIGDNAAPRMAGVAQMVERQVVVLDAVGSSPIARPNPSPAGPSLADPSLADPLFATRTLLTP